MRLVPLKEINGVEEKCRKGIAEIKFKESMNPQFASCNLENRWPRKHPQKDQWCRIEQCRIVVGERRLWKLEIRF